MLSKSLESKNIIIIKISQNYQFFGSFFVFNTAFYVFYYSLYLINKIRLFTLGIIINLLKLNI